MVKKECIYIFFLLTIFTIAIMLIGPLINFISMADSPGTSYFVIRIVFRLLLFAFVLFFICKSGLHHFNGLKHPFRISNIHFLSLPTLFIVPILISWTDTISSLTTTMVILMIAHALLIGLFEEGLVRGIVLPLLIKFGSDRLRFVKALVVSSMIFGLLHYINLFTKEQTFEDVTGQVIYATAVGCFFGGMVLANRNILPAVILHAMINFPSIISKGTKGDDTTPMPTEEGSQWPTLLFFLAVAALGIYMAQQSDKGKILSRLENVTLPFFSLLFGKSNAKKY